MVTPYEGGVKYLNIYVDLDNNKVLTTKELLDKLSVSKDHMNDSLKDYKDIDSIDLDNEVDIEQRRGTVKELYAVEHQPLQQRQQEEHAQAS